MRRVVAWLSAAVFVAVSTARVPPARAQARAAVGPLAGLYAPLSDFQFGPYYPITLPNSPRFLGGLAIAGEGRSGSRGAPIQVATTFRLGSAVPISRSVNASLGLTAYFYGIDVSDSTGTSLEYGFQVDPLFHVGVTWSWR